MSWICGRCDSSIRDDLTHCPACAPNASNAAAHRIDALAHRTGAFARVADVVASSSKTRTATKRRSYNDPAFDEFWSHYPLKLDKKKAHQAHSDAIASGASAQSITDGAMRYARYCAVNATEARHIKYAQGWLNGERWKDELPLPAEVGEGPSFDEQRAQRIAEEERAIRESA